MKSFILLVSLFLSQLVLAQHLHDPASVHGMLLFGKKTFYFSHLPMFHQPHDYQVILEVEISEQSAIAYQKSLTDDELETVYTIVPEKFVLPNLVKNPKNFKFDLFKGHFERGGLFLISGVATIVKVHFFKKFTPAVIAMKNQYIVIKNEEESFLIHVISSKPDFDLVAEINFSGDENFVSGDKLVLPQDFIQTAQEGEFINTAEANFILEKKIYLEFQDLSF